jgi:hypothetical protein
MLIDRLGGPALLWFDALSKHIDQVATTLLAQKIVQVKSLKGYSVRAFTEANA